MAGLEKEAKQFQDQLSAAHKKVEECAKVAKTAEEARKTTDEKLANASGNLAKTKEEVVFLNKAKGGLEELLFKKTAEIRKLKGELRKEQASREKAPETPADEGKGETDRATARVAD